MMSKWDSWIGREELREDRVDPGHAARWLTTLDRAAPADGTMPQGFYWCLGRPDAASARLDPDGHPQRDDSPASFLPPPRAATSPEWASSKVAFHAPLAIGEAVSRVSRVASITTKQGGSGHLVFIDVEHETSGAGGLAVREVQSILYRKPAPAGSAPAPLGEGAFDAAPWTVERMIVPAEPLHLVMRDAGEAIALAAYAADGRLVMSASAAA